MHGSSVERLGHAIGLHPLLSLGKVEIILDGLLQCQLFLWLRINIRNSRIRWCRGIVELENGSVNSHIPGSSWGLLGGCVVVEMAGRIVKTLLVGLVIHHTRESVALVYW